MEVKVTFKRMTGESCDARVSNGCTFGDAFACAASTMPQQHDKDSTGEGKISRDSLKDFIFYLNVWLARFVCTF
jgi:hypothetical protein